ncbi:sensor histidine kinase [Campylobacter sputorum subsp. bubulus]|uniref:histidine kinase n=1 Tax=Campylobacter sputorum subsp. sputorum TaxID=32024 RepID=A0A381DLJ0_9BACT|nr:ArsS family sensor histidine kinase [Campylobacter sputorum]ASM34825.1 two-component system sensor histidine kinase [Campylobacter sputorum aubsp. sputorum RM3237]KAB0581619.1 HAMP domain-containing histidine kinase [Campylobacter sputorum subsp. sputorum]QEL05018.1 two-component system sensor histidine kinase [Campylobacter sputorum subsp. sputorum]SUX10195.1 sensor histidine kinase [Campylobacter sputorum subsp. bubulus]SUX11505.1 sensor histidine kinase [Campylobacter sputorum subsp. spu
MKNRSSIFYAITFIYVLSIICIFVLFLWLINYDKQNYTRELNNKYSYVTRVTIFYLNNMISKQDYEKQMSNIDMPMIEDQKLVDNIIKNANVLQEISGDLGTAAILVYEKRNFLKIIVNDKTFLLQDDDYQPYRYLIVKLILGAVILILLIAYAFILRKIKPLRKLKRQIDKFAKGDLDIKNVKTGNDEISEVADAFYMAVMQIKKLNSSRQLFLRNIMHELKTPITKGRITAEMIQKDKYQERLINVFEKLENLINEFAAVERAASTSSIGNLNSFKIDDIMDEAIDMAMIDKENYTLNILDDITINVDFKLITTAIKNMIDNAIKYSTNKHVNIIVNKNTIKFCNDGKPLDNSIEYYLEAFTQGNNATKSFGLGLYIVDSILKAHGIKLGYKYKNNMNIFYFYDFDKLLVD